MKGYRLNPDKEYVKKIMEGLYKRDGHCPCKVGNDDSILCPCDDFVNDKVCKCKLYVKI